MIALSAKSKTLQTLILEDMFSLKGPTTAEDQARMWGEDVFRCKEWLDKFTSMGLCEKVEAKKSRAKLKKFTGPDASYTPVLAAVLREILKLRRKARCSS